MPASITQTGERPSKYSDSAHLRRLQDAIEERGLCTRPGADPDRWFPEEPSGHATAKRRFYEKAAQARCHGCPVKNTCRVATLLEEQALLGKNDKAAGIRGGLAPWVRDEIRLNASRHASACVEDAA